MKPFALLAQISAKAGIASLRLDAPGVGGSTGDGAASTIEDRRVDAMSALAALRATDRIDATHVGLVGHSEGALVAAAVVARSEAVSFLVALAGPAAPMREVLMDQVEVVLRARGAGSAERAAHRDIQLQTFAAIETEDGWQALRGSVETMTRATIQALPEIPMASLGDIEAVIEAQIDQQLVIAKSPWFQSLVRVDPSRLFADVEAPILALSGEKDFQVSKSLNVPVLRRVLAAAKHPDYQIVVLPAANHLMQEADTGNPAEYGVLEPRFDPAFAEVLVPWLLARVGEVR